MANPTEFIWTIPTENTDGTPIVPGEITGYQIGIRNVANSNVGVYSIFSVVANATAGSLAFASLGATLPPGTYAGAAQTLSTTNGNSGWSNEVTFTWQSTANPKSPTGFTVS